MDFTNDQELAGLLKQQQEQKDKSGLLTALGTSLDSLQSAPSAYQMLYGGKSVEPTASKAMAALNSTNVDPLEQKQKAYAFMKAKSENQQMSDKDNFANSLKDEESPQAKAFKQTLVSSGGDPSAINSSKAYDLYVQGYSPSKMAEIKSKSAVDFDNDMAKLRYSKNADLEKMKAEQALKKGEGTSEGLKAVDKDYAKDYNDWTSAGKSTLSKNLQSLVEARDALDDDTSLVGGLTGTLPDRMTSDRVLKQRQKVQSAVQNSLKATLGAQFTEKEGERILKNAYNEAASPETNKESLNALITQLQSQAANNDAKAKHFEKNGTLTGFQAPPQQKRVMKTQTNPTTGQKRVVYDDGSTEIIKSGKVASGGADGEF